MSIVKSFLSGLDSAAQGAGGGILNSLLNLGSSALTMGMQYRRQKKLMRTQFDLNERAADAQQARLKDMFDYEAAYNSPIATTERLRNAGLNVGQAYSKGGSSVVQQAGVGSPAALPSSLGSVSAPVFSGSSINSADAAMSRYYNALAKKAESETPSEGIYDRYMTSVIDKNNSETALQNYELMFKRLTQDVTIKNLQASVEKLVAESNKLQVEAGKAGAETKYVEALTRESAARVVNLALDAVLKEKQITLTDYQMREIKARITDYYASANLKDAGASFTRKKESRYDEVVDAGVAKDKGIAHATDSTGALRDKDVSTYETRMVYGMVVDGIKASSSLMDSVGTILSRGGNKISGKVLSNDLEKALQKTLSDPNDTIDTISGTLGD